MAKKLPKHVSFVILAISSNEEPQGFRSRFDFKDLIAPDLDDVKVMEVVSVDYERGEDTTPELVRECVEKAANDVVGKVLGC